MAEYLLFFFFFFFFFNVGTIFMMAFWWIWPSYTEVEVQSNVEHHYNGYIYVAIVLLGGFKCCSMRNMVLDLEYSINLVVGNIVCGVEI